jgi:DNA-binding PadR family transcriptional regulator
MLKYLLLALLAERARHGYELKTAFEELLGGTWPLNIGQIYTTLARLEQDGLVEVRLVPQELLPDRKVHALTETGTKELERWLTEDADVQVRLRDDFYLKILAQSAAGVGDPIALIWSQREAFFRALADLAGQRSADTTRPATALLLDAAILRVEADLKWLDLAEQQLKPRP